MGKVVETRSHQVEKILQSFKGAGVNEITINIKGLGPIPLTRNLLIDFIEVVRSNGVEHKIGPWIASLKEVLKVRAARGSAGQPLEDDKELSV